MAMIVRPEAKLKAEGPSRTLLLPLPKADPLNATQQPTNRGWIEAYASECATKRRPAYRPAPYIAVPQTKDRGLDRPSALE